MSLTTRFELVEPCSSNSRGTIVIGPGRGGRAPGVLFAASITVTAVLPATAAVTGHAAPVPLGALAREVQQNVLLAAAAARTLFIQRGSTMALRRRRRAKPAAKRAAATMAALPTTQQPPPATLVVATTTAAAATAAAAQQQQKQRQARRAQQFLAGGIAGAVSKTLVAPLERVSTMLMADAQRFSLKQAAQHAWSTGLYRGHAATLVKIFPASAVQFAVFNGVKDRILAARVVKQQHLLAAASSGGQRDGQPQQQQELAAAPAELANHERLLAGAAAGAASASLCYPLECVRTMMGVAGGVQGNLLQAGRSIVAAHGPGALYRGFRASLIGDVMGNALGFTFYEIGNRIYRDLNGGAVPPPHLRGLIGTCSAACVLTLTLPLEVVRRRLQVQGLAGRPILYRGMLDCIRQVLRKEGLGGFYSASLPSYLKVAPSIGCMYFLFELIMSRPLGQPPPAALALVAAAAPPQPAAAAVECSAGGRR